MVKKIICVLETIKMYSSGLLLRAMK